ncbi:hypothetical protein GCM10023205_13320 [Yinghuangia aomiensis]|uniref:Uncharacterized protein n=2 Tax=Yinghuangia aomiensis TaxID=676205 RepID=A0ABP9GUC9_9ACTN
MLAPSRPKGPCTAAYARDGGLAAKVRDALARTGLAPMPLRDITPFAWDTVYVVPWRRIADTESAPANAPEALTKALGCRPELPDRTDADLGSVLFFTRNGQVIHTLEVWYNLTAPDQNPNQNPDQNQGQRQDQRQETPKAWSSSTTTTRPLDDPSCVRCLVLTDPRPRKRYDSGISQDIRRRQTYGFTPAIPTNAGHLSAPAGMSSTANGL